MTLSSTVPINRMSMVADLRRGTGQVSVVGMLAGLASLAGQRRLGELPTNGHEIHPGMQLCKPVAISNLDGTGAWLYHPAHDYRRDHDHRSPPPHYRGMGGRLRLGLSPLPPDRVPRLLLFPENAV
jgi:hypothetical protein